MGTPASVVRDPPAGPGPAPAPRHRKQAAANIFQGVELRELSSLFRSSGDARAEERARLVWEQAGEQRVARALHRLRAPRRSRRLQLAQLGPADEDDVGALALEQLSSLRIEDGGSPRADPDGARRLSGLGADRQHPATRAQPARSRRPRGLGSGYLHLLQR
ncbi:arginine vasopressin-induced protein 1 [Alligator mississippiensis]|uniref:arginine vasopressin-induced protein 1 n=1 Tax=Alligator mississippiensis TaxID=8496 RepID=UPI0028778FEB|nr:arginine vasopressin-induced protein 1 [Alligator mississippiensis]